MSSCAPEGFVVPAPRVTQRSHTFNKFYFTFCSLSDIFLEGRGKCEVDTTKEINVKYDFLQNSKCLHDKYVVPTLPISFCVQVTSQRLIDKGIRYWNFTLKPYLFPVNAERVRIVPIRLVFYFVSRKKFEDIKWVIRSRNSKENRQYNDQKKKDKQ
jgi:hypothetical protein